MKQGDIIGKLKSGCRGYRVSRLSGELKSGCRGYRYLVVIIVVIGGGYPVVIRRLSMGKEPTRAGGFLDA
jgi:hypothetical protein